MINKTNLDVRNFKVKSKLLTLKRDSIKLKQNDVDNVKSLIMAFGYNFIIADGEADKLCAALVRKNKVYGVLTEDMDLFAYGCPVVFRYISLTNHTIMQYNLKDILKINLQFILIN